jgi:ABC-type transport system substrate-binding protein
MMPDPGLGLRFFLGIDLAVQGLFPRWIRWFCTLIWVEVQVIEPYSEYENRLKNNPPDLFWIGWNGDFNDPEAFIGEIVNRNGDYHGAYNYGKFSNSEMNDLVARATTSVDPVERQALYIQAERILCETEAAVIPIYHNTYNLP